MDKTSKLSGRILVTGANGFVGTHLLPKLSEFCDSSVRHCGIVRHPDVVDDALAGTWSFQQCDLTNGTALDQLISNLRPSIIIHLAAQSSVSKSLGSSADETWTTNFCGTLYLAEAVARHCPDSTVLFSSTAEVYGTSFNQGATCETTPASPQTPYSRSKLACEMMLADVLPESCKLIVTRPTNHSGHGQSTQFVLPSFAHQIAELEQAETPGTINVGNLDVERDFIHVEDVIDAMCGLLLNSQSLPQRSVFNISTGHPRPLRDILGSLISLARVPVEVRLDPERLRPVDVPRTENSPRALMEAINWKPERTLTDILNDILDDQRHASTASQK
jgi:GDP-4-dehydro-6-deoxy-D-mannose reductase